MAHTECAGSAWYAGNDRSASSNAKFMTSLDNAPDAVGVAAGEAPPDIAIAHDYLTQRGGAERVVAAMSRAFPSAPIHTSVHDPAGTFPSFAQRRVHTTPLQRIGPFRRNPRLALAVLAPAISRHVIDAPVTLCSTSGWAHGFPVTGIKVVYAHNTPRWLYQREEYVQHLPRYYAAGLAPLQRPLKRWDRRAATTIDVVLANSEVTRGRIREHWGLDAQVIHPPVGVDAHGPQRAPSIDDGAVEPGFLLAVSRLLPYKRLDVLIEAVNKRPQQRLLVVGDGPDRARLEGLARSNISFIPTVDDATLRWLYAHAMALVTASHEDFGLTPIEALGFGTPTIAIAEGGFLETVNDGVTGLLFEAPSAAAVGAALDRLASHDFVPEELAAHGAQFSEATFTRRLHSVIREAVKAQ